MAMHAETTQDERAPRPGEVVEDVDHPAVGKAQALAADPEGKGAAAVEAFARDHEGLTDGDERDALDFLLAPKPPRLYGIAVDYDTEAGVRKLTFVVRGMDGRRLDAIEQAHISETTGKLDVISAECQLVAEACVWLEDASGRRVEPKSDEFLTIQVPDKEPQKLASPAMAIEARFRTQLGLVAGVATQIRRVSGYDPSRVGSAQRRLADAVGNS